MTSSYAPPLTSFDVQADPTVLDDPLEFAQFSRQRVDADGRPQCESGLQIGGITCAACSGILESALMAVDGVLEARVSAASARASVRWDPARTRPSALIGAIRAAGYDAVPDAAAPARELRRQEHRRALWRWFVAAFCAMQVMMLATPSYVAEAGDLAPDLRQLLNWGQWVLTLPVVVFAAGPFFRGAWRGLRRRQINMDVPVAVGITVAFVASMGATFVPGGLFGHEVWFDSVSMFVAFLLGARFLEMRTRHRAQGELEAALATMPATARRELDDGRLETVSTRRLRPGDRVQVPLGEVFPADGVLLDGATEADEALLTGESTPVAKAAGSPLVAGSVNVGAPARLQVQRVGLDTRYEAIVAMMRDALTQRPAAVQLADRWAGPFLWAVLLLAAGSAAVWSLIDPARALPVAVAVLVVTCPCALSLAAPAALVAAAGGLARRGVMIQRLDAIEGLAAADRLFVDKTGTLTDERAGAARLVPLAGESAEPAEPELAAAVAALAAASTHPLSAALSAARLAPPMALHAVREFPGRGLEGLDAQGRRWQLGAAAWLGADQPPADARALVARDGRLVAAVMLDETVRDDVAPSLSALAADGLPATLLSGDRADRAQRLARAVGITAAIGGATPQDKLDAVAAAQAAGHRVLMVGDGVNDAPVLARADVSLAMGQGALVARAQADAVVVSGRWRDVVRARATARKALRIVRQNLVWAVAYNAVGIPLAVTGWLPPWAAGLGMALSSLTVVLNALRAGTEGGR
jgi:Cu2+-exporting ATPase